MTSISSEVAEADRFPWDYLEGRASLVLKALAAVNVAGMVLDLFPGIAVESILQTVTFNVAAGALAVIYVLTARAIDRHRIWAITAARPLFVLILALGTYWVVSGFAAGKTRIPFEVVMALWVLLGPAAVKPVPAFDRRSAGVAVATALLMISMVFGRQFYGWGGLIDPAVADLHATMTVDCGDPGAGPPATLHVVYDWSWGRASPFPNGSDVVVIGWTGTDDRGAPLYLISEFVDQGPGIGTGQQNEPSREMAIAAESESKGSWHWGIELSQRGFDPGHIDLALGKARDGTPGKMTLTIKATYIHLGIWRADTEPVTCSW